MHTFRRALEANGSTINRTVTPSPASRSKDVSAVESTFLLFLSTRLIGRWPILLIGSLLGAFGGLVFSMVFLPVYQSTAAATIGVDYSRTPPLALIVEDRVLDRVRQVVLSDETMEATLERLRESEDDSGAYASVADLRRALRLDQRLSRWEFLAFDRDPVRGARVANTWREVGIGLLEEARSHAERVNSLQGIPAYVRCIALSPEGVDEDAVWRCVAVGEGLDDASLGALQAEVEASRGLIPFLVFDPTERAEPAVEPVLWGRGLLILAGAVLGLLASIGRLAIPPRRPASTVAA